VAIPVASALDLSATHRKLVALLTGGWAVDFVWGPEQTGPPCSELPLTNESS
jgi:hypothetical protein